MDKPLFRKKSIDALSSPEDLNEYLHSATPAAWMALLAVSILLIGFLVLSGYVSVNSYEELSADVESGMLKVSLEESEAEYVKEGMEIEIGNEKCRIISTGQDEEGAFAVCDTRLPDGRYDARLSVRSTPILKFILN